MENKQRNLAYNNYVKEKIPKTKAWPSLFYSFLVGGAICLLGQGINDLLLLAMPSISQQSAWGYTLIILIFVASLLTGLGVYDQIGKVAGGGSIVPITGFANSVVSPAMEFKTEGFIYGVASKMFVVAGPIIVFGIIASVLVGLIYFGIYRIF